MKYKLHTILLSLIKKIILITLHVLLVLNIPCYSQMNPPWERPLKIAWSGNGTLFTNETIFQDSSGVPSAIKWKGDTIACVFQWFRAPVGTATWDRVAVKFSYDNGGSWTNPVPIIINGLPSNFQRPFDPTLARINSDSLRIYFSSSNGLPPMGLDSTVNTYSAISTDGINYTFEPQPRFDHPTNKAIDPAILFFNGQWHYSCPIGAPQAGAYHATSPDGINFTQQIDFPSDPLHNWTGNMLFENFTEMKFYGSGSTIWHNSTSDGFTWNGYTPTNLIGGDPTAVKISPGNYFIIYVGPPYTTEVIETNEQTEIKLYPNPTHEFVSISGLPDGMFEYKIYSETGAVVSYGSTLNTSRISVATLARGYYLIEIPVSKKQTYRGSFTKD